MLKRNLVAGIGVSMALFACSPADMPTRGLSGSPSDLAVASGNSVARGAPLFGAHETVAVQYNIVGHTIDVPRTLLVSEADVYVPAGDIVWHGDPPGDRYQQVQALFEAGFATGTANMKSGRPVIVNVELEKFHALSEKTRATFGGNFAMHFLLTVRDATTMEVLDGPRKIVADVHGSGGEAALREEQNGITQTTVVEGRLAEVFARELSRMEVPAGAEQLISRNDFSPSDLTLVQ
ncbi:MAG: DUF6778 family protein [bacterium]